MSQFTPEFNSKVRRNFRLDVTAGTSYGLFAGAVSAFVLVQARRLGATPFEVSFLAAMPYIWLLFSPLWVRFIGHKNPYKTVLLFDALARFAFVFLLLNTSHYWYLFLFCVYYFFSSISITVYGEAMRFGYPTSIRGRLMGWVRVGVCVTMMISTALAGVLLPLWGVQKLFAVLSIFGIGAALTFGQIRKVIDEPLYEEKPRVRTSPFQILKKDTEFRHYMIAFFLFGLANIMSLPIYTLFHVDALKVNDAFIALIALIASGSALVFYYIGGRLIDRTTPLHLTILVFGCGLVIPAIYFLTKSPWPLLMVAVLQGLVNAGLDLITFNNILFFAKDRDINAYTAVHMNLQGIRGTIGPLISPFLVGVLSYKGFFIIILILSLLGFYEGWKLFRTATSGAAEVNQRIN